MIAKRERGPTVVGPLSLYAANIPANKLSSCIRESSLFEQSIKKLKKIKNSRNIQINMEINSIRFFIQQLNN
jgi:hypothetical protein